MKGVNEKVRRPDVGSHSVWVLPVPANHSPQQACRGVSAAHQCVRELSELVQTCEEHVSIGGE